MMINFDNIYDGDIKKLIRELDNAGFGKALLCGYPNDMVINEKRYPNDSNSLILEAVEQYPNRIIGGVYVNPLEKDSIGIVKRYAEKGFKAVKIIPADGYYLDDKSLYTFFEEIERMDMVVIVQAGLCEFSYCSDERKAPNSSYGIPMKLDPVCRLFPSLNFVVLNMGYPFMMETWSVHHNSKNIYLHIGGDSTSFTSLATCYVALGGAGFVPLDYKRIIFGSGNSPDMKTTYILAQNSIERMGGKTKNLFENNITQLLSKHLNEVD